MAAVLAGMSVVWVIILLGWALGRLDVLGPGAEEVLNRLVYWVATPALLFATLATTDIRALVGAPLAVAALSGVSSALTFALLSRFVFRDPRGHTVVGTMGASVANAAHLGIPLAAYVLGSATHSVPVLLFQLGFLTPMFFVLADLVSQGSTSPGRVVRVVTANPLVLAAVAGMALGATGTTPPDLVMEPFRVVGAAAVPAVLIAFGMSLAGTTLRVLPLAGHSPGDDDGRAVATARGVVVASALKLLVQPVFAWLAATQLFALDGHALFAVVAMAGLPAAQNTYVAAFRTGTATGLARGIVLATTLFAIPSLAGIAALLA
ncbi:MAG: AEC family transporter [Actinomycetota bacterium]